MNSATYERLIELEVVNLNIAKLFQDINYSSNKIIRTYKKRGDWEDAFIRIKAYGLLDKNREKIVALLKGKIIKNGKEEKFYKVNIDGVEWDFYRDGKIGFQLIAREVEKNSFEYLNKDMYVVESEDDLKALELV